MKAWAVIVAGFLLSPLLHAEQVQSRTETKRGAFSIAPIYGQTWHRLISAEGQGILFTGQHYGVDGSLTLFDPVSLFIETRVTTAANENFSNEKLSGQGYSFGLRLAAASWLDVRVGYGQEHDKVTSANKQTYQVVNQTLSAGLTFHIFDFSEAFGFLFQTNYRLGNATASKNGNGDHNSGLEAFEVSIGFRWSPSVNFTYSK